MFDLVYLLYICMYTHILYIYILCLCVSVCVFECARACVRFSVTILYVILWEFVCSLNYAM